MPDVNAVEKVIHVHKLNELGRAMRQWIDLEIERVQTSLSNPKYDAIETALLRGEYRALRKQKRLLEETNEPV